MRYLISVTKDGTYIVEGFKRSGGRTIPVPFERLDLEKFLREGKTDFERVLAELDRMGRAEVLMVE